MKASSAAKPFTGAGNQNLFKEMDNLSPFMQPEQMEEKPWWQNISLGQVVRPASLVPISWYSVCSFAAHHPDMVCSTLLTMREALETGLGCVCPQPTGVACLTVRFAVQLIVLSFTLIISLMIGTFTVVYKVGAVRFNE